MAKLKQIIDTEGTSAATKVLLDLLNEFPGIPEGMTIKFATLEETGGISFNPTSGATYIENREDITGHVYQVCAYPFVIIFRSAARTEDRKILIKEFLDLLARWLEGDTVTIGGVDYKLEQYPDLSSGDRKITTIVTTNASHCQAAYADGIEDWSISMTMRYRNDFLKGRPLGG